METTHTCSYISFTCLLFGTYVPCKKGTLAITHPNLGTHSRSELSKGYIPGTQTPDIGRLVRAKRRLEVLFRREGERLKSNTFLNLYTSHFGDPTLDINQPRSSALHGRHPNMGRPFLVYRFGQPHSLSKVMLYTQ